MDSFWHFMDQLNGVLWHDYVLYVLLLVGLLFTVWSGFSQYRALTHGLAVVRGKFDERDDPGAINHFQALSTALSGTVGLGNIAGVAVAVSLGGPGAVLWMWVVGFVGMALKLTEVTQAMLFRNTDDPENPHGGAMWVCKKGFAKIHPALAPVGIVVGGIFCITVLISAITGGNMFQAWNVAKITTAYFPSINPLVAGVVMSVVVGLTIIGGIKRIGAVTGRLVPFMCLLYLLGAIVVLAINIGAVPSMLRLIVVSGLPPFLGGENANPTGAFLGGTFGYAFLWGMKRALFSNEAGQGSAPMAHAAAKTKEPVREGVVAGLEPFIDTLVVCTLTALVVLSSGAWNRGAAATYDSMPGIVAATDGSGNPISGQWVPDRVDLPAKPEAERKISNVWRVNDELFIIVKAETDSKTGRDLHRLRGRVVSGESATDLRVSWSAYAASTAPTAHEAGIYLDLVGSSLTGYAFDRTVPGMGMWIVTLAAWLFAISTMISWSYYGEQATVFLLGKWAILPYKLLYCVAILIASAPNLIKSDVQLDALTALGTGVMLWANIPIMLIFGPMAMRAYHQYMKQLKGGEFKGHAYPSITDVAEGKDVQ
ncbi:MAG: amino acid carrier protein [Phycisphaeraceae bacterium]|nr:amino acid carrier protein [Phycisphaeraceae bacterium]